MNAKTKIIALACSALLALTGTASAHHGANNSKVYAGKIAGTTAATDPATAIGGRALLVDGASKNVLAVKVRNLKPNSGLSASTRQSQDAGRGLAAERPVPSQAMELILSVLQVVICIVLIFLILMHSGKDAGLSGAFGVGSGQGPLGGGSLVERNLNRWTIGFAILFAVNTIVLIKQPW